MRKTITRIGCVFMLICMVFTSVLTIFPIESNAAYDVSVDSIKDDKERVAYKIWSLGKVAGMTDYECAGIIDNVLGESGLNAKAVESWPGSWEFDGTTITDPTKIPDWCAYTTNVVFPGYTYSGAEIEDSNGHTAPQGSGSVNINPSGYIMENGHFGPGLGMCQWTGPQASKLIKFAQQKSLNWYDEDIQLLYMFNLKSGTVQSGKAEWIRDYYIGKGGSSIKECSYLWQTKYEGIPGDPNNLRRETETTSYYEKFKGSKGDVEYASSILKKASFPILLPGAGRSIIDKSLIHEYTSRVILFAQSSGFAFDTDGTADSYAREASTAILESMKEYTSSADKTVSTPAGSAIAKKYSLYDLFGSDIHWYRYMGESTQQVQLLDHVWSAWNQGKLGMLTISDTVFYSSSRYLSTKVYYNRQKVLTVQDTKEGKYDPRVNAITKGRFNGYNYVIGSGMMSISKQIVSLVSFLMGPKPMEAMNDMLQTIFGASFWPKIFIPVVIMIVSLVMVAFIFSLVGKVKKYAVGQAGRKEVFTRVIGGLVALAIIGGFAYNPGTFLNIVTKVSTAVDEMFNGALTAMVKEDDVVGSTDGTKTTEAMLWKTAVFQPWCVGQFGDRYENLYTQYATLKSGQSRMEQSNYLLTKRQNQIDPGKFEYSSATYTGDVVVPVGNNYYIRNWAAYLYSCQSKYHIDQNYIDGRTSVPATISFPNMNTTAYDSEVAADTFRVIDAQMDISPQLYKDKTEYTYTGAHQIENHFYAQGFLMMIYSIILAVSFMPAIFQKLYAILRMFLLAVQFVFMGIKELAKEGDGLSEILRQMKEQFFKYLLAALRLFVLVQLYYILVGQDMLRTMFYCILTMAVYSLTYDSIHKGIHNAKHTVSVVKRSVKNNI